MQIIFLKNSDNSLNLVQKIIDEFRLDLSLTTIEIDTINNKNLKRQFELNEAPILYFDKDKITLASFQKNDSQNNEILKVSPDWQSYQSRIVKAGQKNEMLLKIAKLKDKMRAIDGTAGFGIDALILASTGASVTLIEQNPILFLMLKAEQHKMSQHKNWQKLMSRIDIIYGDSGNILHTLDKVDLIYLDPMFPNDSYKGLVNKNMQVLHKFVNPPNSDDEKKLFNSAIHKCDRLVIKRPISAPNFADINPMQSIANDVIRFDEYRLLGVKECQLM